jgi:hypothetical protein
MLTMNRRTLLTSLAALGLVAATPEPVRRVWALDQTMVPDPMRGLVYPDEGDRFWWGTAHLPETWYDIRGDPFAITFVNGVYIKHRDHPTLTILP